MDSFCLSNGRSLGFVRAVASSFAADALLETDRLQVMSHVYVISSPTYEFDQATNQYSSHMNSGKGVDLAVVKYSSLTGSGTGYVVVFLTFFRFRFVIHRFSSFFTSSRVSDITSSACLNRVAIYSNKLAGAACVFGLCGPTYVFEIPYHWQLLFVRFLFHANLG